MKFGIWNFNALTLTVKKLNRIIESYPPELKLLLACCGSVRWNAEELLPGIDWELFLQWVKRHRVNPHVYQFGIKNPAVFPIEILIQINETQKVNTQRMLRLTGEMLRLQNLFTSNNINNIPIKGPALAYQLYNDPGMRHSIDLDFLILPEDLDKVSKLMVADGYKQIKPDFALSPRQKKAQITSIHHANFINIKTGLSVEMHWRLITPKSLFLNAEKHFFNNIQQIQQNTFIKPELLLHYILIHGSTHRWFKVFWLKDVDEFFCRNLIADFDYFNKLTETFSDERIINQSLAMAKILFNTHIPKEITQNIYSEKLIAVALNAIVTPEEKLQDRSFSRFNRLFYIMKLKSGLKHFLSCIKAPGTNYMDWEILPLPDSLFFLYYPFRPFLWLWSVYVRKERKA